ncbi:MAG: type IV secretion system protein [Rickettsiales bacterium]|nr:type IV secretion system protein [Rickettsiales bacterium]
MAGKVAAKMGSLKKKLIIFGIIIFLLWVLTVVEFFLGMNWNSSGASQTCGPGINAPCVCPSGANPPFNDSNGNPLCLIEPLSNPGSFANSSANCQQLNQENFLSKVFNFLVTPIQSQVSIVSQEIFIQIVTSAMFQRIVNVVLILYVVIWGIYIALGLTQTSLKNFISRVFKIGIVLALITPYSYSFFNEYLFTLFTAGTQELIGMVANPYCDNGSESNYFAFTNYTMHVLFGQPHLFLRISSTIMAFPIGWLCFIIFCYTIALYFMAILRAILAYLIAYTAIGLVISLGPIFIVMLLFERTKHLFLGWMGVLVSFAMEPVILFASIVLITLFVDQALYDVMGNLEWLPFLNFWVNFGAPTNCADTWECIEILDIYWYLPSFYNSTLGTDAAVGTAGAIAGVLNVSSYITYIQSYIVLFIGVGLLDKVGEFATSTSTYLFGGAGMLSAANNMIGKAKDSALSVVGMDSKSKARRQESKGKSDASAAKSNRAARWK